MSLDKSAMHKIAAERFRLAVILTAIMLVAYFGFIMLVAFNKLLLSILLNPGLKFWHPARRAGDRYRVDPLVHLCPLGQ